MIRRLALIALACALQMSCTSFDDPVAGGGGGDDFPNSATAAALGEQIAGALNQYQRWDSLFLAPGELPSISGGTDISNVPGSRDSATGLARRLGGAVVTLDTTWYNYADTATMGLIYKLHHSVTDLVTTHDTTVILWDAAARDLDLFNDHTFSVSGAVDNRLNRIDYYRYEDADGDSIMNNNTGTVNRVRMTFISVAGLSGTRTVLVADAGPDKSFLSVADMKIFESTYAKVSSGDTLEYYAFVDADGDSVVYDAADADSCLVDFQQKTAAGPLQISEPLTHELAMRLVVFPTDTGKNYLARLWSTDRYRSGAALQTTLFGSRTDSCFYAGDTLTGQLVTWGGASQALAVDTTRIAVKLGRNAKVFTDDSLLSVSRHVYNRSGDEHDRLIAFVCARPTLVGTMPAAGSLTVSIFYPGTAWVELVGTFDAEEIDVLYSNSVGKRLRLLWNRLGALLGQTEQ